MTTQTQFAIGDRVKVVGTNSIWKEYIGVTGVVVKASKGCTKIKPDFRPTSDSSVSDYDFGHYNWTLELDGPTGPEPYEEWFR